MMVTVSRDLGIPGAPASAPTPGPSTAPCSHERPRHRPRHPRCGPPARAGAIPGSGSGVAIVAVSVVAGSRLLAAADDTVAVWAVVADLGPGDTVAEADLEARRVRFADTADLDRYVDRRRHAARRPRADPRASVPASCSRGRRWARAATAARCWSGSRSRTSRSPPRCVGVVGRRLPGRLPARRPQRRRHRGSRPWRRSPWSRRHRLADNLAATGNRTIDVAVTEQQARAYFEDRAGLESPTVTVVKVG